MDNVAKNTPPNAPVLDEHKLKTTLATIEKVLRLPGCNVQFGSEMTEEDFQKSITHSVIPSRLVITIKAERKAQDEPEPRLHEACIADGCRYHDLVK